MGEGDRRTELVDAVALWSARAVDPDEVVDLATHALADGHDEAWVLALACVASPVTSRDLEDALLDHHPDLGFAILPMGNDDALVAAARVYARRCLHERMELQSLTVWARGVVARGGPDRLAPLLHLDHEYELMPYTGRTEAEIDAEVLAVARELLEG